MEKDNLRNKFSSVAGRISGKAKDFLDRFKPKYDTRKSPLAAAIEHFHPQLSEWQENDEWRLSMAVAYEGNMGWGGLDKLGILFTKDKRPIASFASMSSSNMGELYFEMLVSTRKESFSYTLRDNENVMVYYGNTFIGRINNHFSIFNPQDQLIASLGRDQASGIFSDSFNAIGPARFQFYTGLSGWFNIPPRNKILSGPEVLIEGQAMSLAGNRLPQAYERMWMLALYFLLRLGIYSSEEYVTTAREDFWNWVGDVFIPD